MKKKISILCACLFAVAVLSGCGEKNKNEDTGQANQSGQVTAGDENENTEEESITGSIKDLLTKGKSMKCTYKETRDGETFSGVLYVAGNKSKTEIEFQVDGKTGNMYTLSDGEWVYSWGTFLPQGVKMNIKEMPKDQTDNSQETASNFEKKMNYKCRFWIKDSSKFELPADVQFRDMTDSITGAAEAVKNIEGNLCEMCEIMPAGSGRDSCMAECKSGN